jgi:hypothetical protein
VAQQLAVGYIILSDGFRDDFEHTLLHSVLRTDNAYISVQRDGRPYVAEALALLEADGIVMSDIAVRICWGADDTEYVALCGLPAKAVRMLKMNACLAGDKVDMTHIPQP